MSSFLIQNAKIIHPKSPFNNTRKDLLLKNGVIQKIGDNLKDGNAQKIASDNLHVSIGWFDIGTAINEPGFEHRETLEELSQTAASGGFTGLAVYPNSYPVSDSKSSIQYLLNTTAKHMVDYYPIAAVSKKCAGEEITEMIDLSKNGAVAFSDGHKTIKSSGVLLRALQYATVFNGLIIHHPSDPGISNGNDIHEGIVSTSLGLKASPALSELLFLERDLQLTAYAESRMLSHTLSSKEAVSRMKQHKQKNNYASVAYLNLCKTESSINSFDVNYKVAPPLRSEDDRVALIEAIKDGSIDIICSNHVPLEEELKKKEFVYADPGATGLQTVYSGLRSFTELSISKLVTCLAHNPRKIMDLEIPKIEESAQADLCLFDPDLTWTLNESSNTSPCKNNPFWDQELKGKVMGVIKSKQSHFNNY